MDARSVRIMDFNETDVSGHISISGQENVSGFLSAATSRTAVTAGSATMGFLGGGVAEADHFDGKGE